MAHDDIVSSMVLELRRGTLVMLVLSQLRQPAYGYALVKSLADHGGSKPRKYYRTTDEGLCVLREVEAQWHVLCDGGDKLLGTDGEDRDHAER